MGSEMCIRDRTDIVAAKEALQSALNAGNIDDIKAKTEALTEKYHTISTKLYQQAQQAQAAGAGPDMSGMGGMGNMGGMGGNPGADAQAGPANDNVVDADFEVVDDEK